MKKYFKSVFTLLFLIAVLSVPFFVFGAGLNEARNNLNTAAGSTAAGYNTNTNNPVAIVGSIIGAVLGLLGVVFLALMVWAGFNWMTAGGDKSKVETAQGTIQRAIIGLIVIASAYALSSFVLEKVLNATG